MKLAEYGMVEAPKPRISQSPIQATCFTAVEP
jgi:hypothetical protein